MIDNYNKGMKNTISKENENLNDNILNKNDKKYQKIPYRIVDVTSKFFLKL